MRLALPKYAAALGVSAVLGRCARAPQCIVTGQDNLVAAVACLPATACALLWGASIGIGISPIPTFQTVCTEIKRCLLLLVLEVCSAISCKCTNCPRLFEVSNLGLCGMISARLWSPVHLHDAPMMHGCHGAMVVC